MNKLKRDDMAQKTAKLLLPEIVKDSKDNNLKERVLSVLEKTYAAGFDLAKEECRAENSRSGEDMYHYLNELEVNHEVTL